MKNPKRTTSPASHIGSTILQKQNNISPVTNKTKPIPKPKLTVSAVQESLKIGIGDMASSSRRKGPLQDSKDTISDQLNRMTLEKQATPGDLQFAKRVGVTTPKTTSQRYKPAVHPKPPPTIVPPPGQRPQTVESFYKRREGALRLNRADISEAWRDPFDSTEVEQLVNQASQANNFLANMKSNHLSVTDVTKLSWCTMNISFSLHAPLMNITSAAALKGQGIHAELEEEVYRDLEHREVTYRNKSEYIAYTLLNTFIVLARIANGQASKAREVYVMGYLHYNNVADPTQGVFMRGYIDNIEVRKSDGKLMIKDEKTRAKRASPHPNQQASNEIQLALYHQLLSNYPTFLRQHFQTYCKTCLSVDIDEKLNHDISDEAAANGVLFKGDVTLRNIANALSEAFSRLPPLTDDMEVLYIFQETRELVHTQKCTFNDSVWMTALQKAITFFTGKCPPKKEPVGSYKCGYCNYKHICRLKDGNIEDRF